LSSKLVNYVPDCRPKNSVAITWLWQGTHLGDIAGFPGTGKKIKMSGATVYYFDGDRISGHWQIADRLSVYKQLQAMSVENKST